MADTTTTSLQAIGLTSAFIVSGFSFGVSWMVLPSTYKLDPAASLPVFKAIFYNGGKFVLPAALLGTITTGTAAYRASEQRVPLSIAAALAIGPAIFTRVVMMPGINKLLSYETNAADRTRAGVGEIVGLLQAWNAQNLVRATMSFAAGALGLYLLLQNVHGKQIKRL